MAQAQTATKAPLDMGRLQELLSDQKKISAEIDKQLSRYEESMKYASEQRKISNEIDKEVSGKKAAQTLVRVTPSKIGRVITTLANKAISSGKIPVLVLTTTNYKSMLRLLEEEGVDKEKAMIIDCVTRNVYRAKNTKNIGFVDSLRNLTQIQIKVIKFFEKQNNSVFIFDSLDPLELYHEDETIFKFVHSLTKILRHRALAGYYLFTKEELIMRLGQFFDAEVSITSSKKA